MLALVALLAATTPAPAAQHSEAEARYVAALERMRATREPLVAVYRAKLSVPQGQIEARRNPDGDLFLRFGQGYMGVSDEDFFVRIDRGQVDYHISLPGRRIAFARLPLFNATWQGIDAWIRFGFEGDPSTATPAPATPGPSTNLHVIAVVTSFGLAFYDASDGGTGTCANGDAAHLIRLAPRGDPMEHPLREVTIDDVTGLFCTMHFVAPAVADPGVSALAYVGLHLGEIGGYYLVQNENIDLVGTAARGYYQHVSATLTFDDFSFSGGP